MLQGSPTAGRVGATVRTVPRTRAHGIARRVLPILVPLLAGTAAAQDDVLTGVERTARFEIRFRPGSRAESSVDRVAALVEGDLALILRELGLDGFPHVIKLWLYDDVAELQRVTGVGASGFSVPLQSHVPHDNDQTRVHELVHVVAEKFTEQGPEQRNLFFAEGLANAVLRYVHGVHVDAVAAFHRRRGDLPGMVEMHAVGDFYAWLGQHPAVNAYDVAGSWMRFLLDVHGAAAVRRYYKGVPAKAAFGKEVAELERDWHARLEAVQLRPGVLSLLRERHGRTAAERNPAEAALGEGVLGAEAAWQARGAADLHAGDPGAFEADGGALVLSGRASQGDWCVARLGGDLGDAIARCVFEPQQGCYGVQLQLGPACQGMVLRGQGTFAYGGAGCVGHDGSVQLGDRPVQIVLRRKGARASVWIDGKLVLEADVGDGKGPLGVGCVGGPARVRGVAVRAL
jgi:hypothetical protein